MNKLILAALVAVFVLGIGGATLAQDNVSTSATDNVSAQDLGVQDPSLLPNSPFYFLKEWGRGIQSFFAFGQLKKADLEQKIASERLVEIKKMVDIGKVSQDVLEKATDKYEKTMEKIKKRADKIKEKASENTDVNKFLDKFTNQQVLHEKILQKLEEKVPQQVLEKIKEAREQHLEKFKEVMTKLEQNKEKIAEKIVNALQNGDTANPEILDKIKEKMPDDVKEKLGQVRTKINEKVCSALKAQINNSLKQANYCNEDADCKISDIYCNKLVNKTFDLTKIEQTIRIYTEKCNPPALVCAPTPSQDNIKCVEKKCVNTSIK